MPHRSSLFCSSPSVHLPLERRASLFSFSPSLSLYPTSRAATLPLSIIFRPETQALFSLSLSPFITEAPVHVWRIPVSRSRAIDKVILITESCSSLISDRYNHKPPVLSRCILPLTETSFVPRRSQMQHFIHIINGAQSNSYLIIDYCISIKVKKSFRLLKLSKVKNMENIKRYLNFLYIKF